MEKSKMSMPRLVFPTCIFSLAAIALAAQPGLTILSMELTTGVVKLQEDSPMGGLLVISYVFPEFKAFSSTKLGITSPSAHLSVFQNVDTLLKGVKYASDGARILNDTELRFIQGLSWMIK
ncbi:hypothetical protein VNO77_32178 [Canavalia gladiata]|uniref:Uncharacterized protein n=1 Tax=Canavalia gladiata TaxID=3824 RepID=A0AAN9Q4A6_CANGL